MRSAVAAAFPLFTDQMFHNLGVNWAATLLALVALILAPSPFLFYKYGVSVRRRSTFAPCLVSDCSDPPLSSLSYISTRLVGLENIGRT